MRATVIAWALVAVTAAPAAAQLTPEQARAKAAKAPVVVVVPDGNVRGQLIDMDDETVTILRDGGSRRTIPLASVFRIESKKGDSIVNGTLIGALVMTVYCVAVCKYGLHGDQQLDDAIKASTVMGAAIGAAIDAGRTRNVTLYKRPEAGAVFPSRGVSFSVRF